VKCWQPRGVGTGREEINVALLLAGIWRGARNVEKRGLKRWWVVIRWERRHLFFASNMDVIRALLLEV
jgi:hypothetical protein